MRIRLLWGVLLACGGACAQVAVLNDWKESVPDSVVSATCQAGGQCTNLIYRNGHGYAAGLTPQFEIWGANLPQAWTPILTRTWLHTLLSIAPTDTTIDVDRPDLCTVPGTARLNSTGEQIVYTAKTNNILTVSRGANGTSASADAPDQIQCNFEARDSWTAAVIDAKTLQIPLDSHAFGPFSGTIHLLRYTGDNQQTMPNTAEVGSLNDGATNSHYLQQTFVCTNPKDLHQCLRAYWTPGTFAGKYGPGVLQDSATCAITNLVANGQGMLTATLSVNGNLGRKCDSGYTLGARRIAYLSGFNDTLLNIRPLYITTASNSQVTLSGADPGIPPGTYTGSAPVLQVPSSQTAPYLFEFSALYGGIYSYPNGYMAAYIKTNNFDPAANRMSFYISYSNFATYLPRNHEGPFYVGTYIKNGGIISNVHDAGSHFYHYGPPFTLYPGRFLKFEWNEAPEHEVGASGAAVWPNDPMYSGVWSYPGWGGNGYGKLHYFAGLTTWYINFEYGQNVNPGLMSLGEIDSYKVLNEPEELVRARTIVWAPDRLNVNTPGYEVAWNSPKNTNISYQVNYSTAGSLKTIGFSAGSDGGVVHSLASSYTGVLWQSPPMPEAAQFWAGIRPTVSIASTTQEGQAPVWIITQDDLNMQPGDHVTVSNVTGNTAANQSNVALSAVQPRQFWSAWDPTQFTITSAVAGQGGTVVTTALPANWATGSQIQIVGSKAAPSLNGVWTITALGPNTFSIPAAISGYRPSDQATAAAKGTIANVVAQAGLCTANLTVTHNLLPGWKIFVSGATNPVLGPDTSSGATAAIWTVTSVVNTSSFQFGCPGVPDGAYTDDHAANSPFVIVSWPGVALAPEIAGNGTYSNSCQSLSLCGQIVSTEEKKNFAEVTIRAQAASLLTRRPE
ncbi:MAG TPA: hypothetical protein VKV17_23310 [Bryobacteraceae bacterium]|nr:hypothetical protein [Bryobacteraceae bacterium]